ncbi:MAG: translation initiation factor IF-3 [Sutterella sp. 54_7]|nr:MAG: translation initiation factor IF-3 [Sutterella sp. 54_7]
MAEDAGVDLVEVAPNAVPPVCRLMDYGKFRYQEQKKAQEAKAKQKVVQIKEVKFRPATDENDFQTKLRSLKRFLEAQLMDRVREELVDIAQVEHAPKLEGRQMIMVLAPKKKR